MNAYKYVHKCSLNIQAFATFVNTGILKLLLSIHTKNILSKRTTLLECLAEKFVLCVIYRKCEDSIPQAYPCFILSAVPLTFCCSAASPYVLSIHMYKAICSGALLMH